jgi:hypothetical protein
MSSNRELEYNQAQVTASDFAFEVKRVSTDYRWASYEPLEDVGYDRINVVRPKDSVEFLRRNTSIEEKLDEAGIGGDTFNERLEELKSYNPTENIGNLEINKIKLQGELGEELAQTQAEVAGVDSSEAPTSLDRSGADIDGLGMRDGSLVTVESKYSTQDTTLGGHLRENTGWEEMMGFDDDGVFDYSKSEIEEMDINEFEKMMNENAYQTSHLSESELRDLKKDLPTEVDRDVHNLDLRLDPEIQQVLQDEIPDLGAASQYEESHTADVLAELGDDIPEKYIEK